MNGYATPIGATVMIGVILLVGVIVGNGIILVELANQIRERDGIHRREAMLEAAPARLRPITMTTIIAVLGLLPLALGLGEGTELLRPLGITVFAGLSLGTLLTLFVVPCLYLTLHDLFHWNPFSAWREQESSDAQSQKRRKTRGRRAGAS